MSLNVVHQMVADAQISQIALRPLLGAFELLIGVSGKSTPHDPGKTPWWYAAANARVEVTGPQSQSHQLGTALLGQPCRFAQHPRPSYISMELKLALLPSQIAAIEDVRAGGDLRFQVYIVGEGGGGDNPGAVHPTHDMQVKEVARSDWIRQLRDAKAMDILLLEIPMPFVDPPPELRPVIDNMRQAQKLFYEGHYADCLINCRKSVDTLATLQKQGRNWSSDALKRLASEREAMSKNERLIAAEACLYHFASPGAHDGTLEIFRRDAKFALALTATLLSRELGIAGC
ncbi:MAG: hypothetical protein V4559_10760 [Pseudomonadota bacterium]